MRADPIARFRERLANETASEVVAAAFAEHLGQLTVGGLAAQAQPHWRDIARLLKSSADKPMAEKAVAAIRSWPASRVTELISHIRKLDDILAALENERLEDDIRDSIRRHYL